MRMMGVASTNDHHGVGTDAGTGNESDAGTDAGTGNGMDAGLSAQTTRTKPAPCSRQRSPDSPADTIASDHRAASKKSRFSPVLMHPRGMPDGRQEIRQG